MKNTSKRKAKKVGDTKQKQLFADQNLIILDTLEFGKEGTKLLLVESESGKSRYIQMWSSLSKRWNTMHRYNVETEWEKWKATHARIHSEKSKDRRTLGRDVQLGSVPDVPKRKPRAKTRAKSTEDSKQRGGKQRSKSTRRVQGSTKKQSEKGIGKR